MWGRLALFFLLGSFCRSSAAFRRGQVNQDDIEAWIQDEVEEERVNLLRSHRDVLESQLRPDSDELPIGAMPMKMGLDDSEGMTMTLEQETGDMPSEEGFVKTDRQKRPRPSPDELPIAIMPLKDNLNGEVPLSKMDEGLQGDAAEGVEATTSGEMEHRQKRPRPSPDELPIAIMPLKDNLDGEIPMSKMDEGLQGDAAEGGEDNTPGEMEVEDRQKRPRPSPDEVPIAIMPLKAKTRRNTSRRTPILNVLHRFKFPVFDVSSNDNKESPVIEEEPGVVMDTRPLSLRQSPAPVEAERAATICGGTFNGLSGIINSPDYPFNYPDNIRCVYKIILEPGYTVALDCNDFSIQPGDKDCENDFLSVSDNGGEVEPTTKYCGDKAITAFSHSSNMTVVFQTDSAYRYRGFMCRYRALNPDGTGAEGIVHVNSTAAQHTVICTGPGDDGWAGKCGVSNVVSTRIVGGHNIQEHQFPWMVAVLKECGKDLEHYCHICGGTVIHNQWILTGAHCLVSVHVETIALLLGDHNLYTLTPSQKFFRVEAVYVHPDFNVPSPLNNDVALAKLPQTMAFNKYIAPICMPPAGYLDLLNLLPRQVNEGSGTSTPAPVGRQSRQGATTEVPLSHKIIHENLNGRNVSIFGWGTINDDAQVSQTLRGVTVTVLPNEECDYYYGVMTDTMMCTSGDGGHGPCQGDSGSPAQMQMVDGRWIQLGVLAFGAAYGCEVGYPSGNVLLPVFVDWIQFVTGVDFTEYY
ncbi:ovochymase-like [Palaemon carinicauda]|uniref:ovochymase-like n=1 Tax=Palaemon carinicauda TaxID=392227 RepID=UPI0035B66023